MNVETYGMNLGGCQFNGEPRLCYSVQDGQGNAIDVRKPVGIFLEILLENTRKLFRLQYLPKPIIGEIELVEDQTLHLTGQFFDLGKPTIRNGMKMWIQNQSVECELIYNNEFLSAADQMTLVIEGYQSNFTDFYCKFKDARLLDHFAEIYDDISTVKVFKLNFTISFFDDKFQVSKTFDLNNKHYNGPN